MLSRKSLDSKFVIILDMDWQKFCERLVDLRNEKEWTQRQFAEKLSVYQADINRWETGKHRPSVDMVVKMAKIFSVSTDYLLALTDY